MCQISGFCYITEFRLLTAYFPTILIPGMDFFLKKIIEIPVIRLHTVKLIAQMEIYVTVVNMYFFPAS